MQSVSRSVASNASSYNEHVGLPMSIEHHVYQMITRLGQRPGWGIACCSSAATIINLNNPAMAPEPPLPPPAVVPPVTAAAAQVSESHCWNCSTDGPTGKHVFLSFCSPFVEAIDRPYCPQLLPHARATDRRGRRRAGRTIALGMTLRVVMRHATRYFEDLTWKVGNHGMAL